MWTKLTLRFTTSGWRFSLLSKLAHLIMRLRGYFKFMILKFRIWIAPAHFIAEWTHFLAKWTPQYISRTILNIIVLLHYCPIEIFFMHSRLWRSLRRSHNTFLTGIHRVNLFFRRANWLSIGLRTFLHQNGASCNRLCRYSWRIYLTRSSSSIRQSNPWNFRLSNPRSIRLSNPWRIRCYPSDILIQIYSSVRTCAHISCTYIYISSSRTNIYISSSRTNIRISCGYTHICASWYVYTSRWWINLPYSVINNYMRIFYTVIYQSWACAV